MSYFLYFLNSSAKLVIILDIRKSFVFFYRIGGFEMVFYKRGFTEKKLYLSHILFLHNYAFLFMELRIKEWQTMKLQKYNRF